MDENSYLDLIKRKLINESIPSCQRIRIPLGISGDEGECAEVAKPMLEQAGSLFAFLKDVLRLRNRPQKSLDGYANTPGGWVHHMDETPVTKNGIEFWGSLGIKAISSLQGDVVSAVQLGITTFKEMKGAILRFPRVVSAEPPAPSEKLGPWIDGDIDDAYGKPMLLEVIEEISDDGESYSNEPELFVKDFPDIQGEFDRWKTVWEKWAERAKEDQDVRRIYSSLFEARNQVRDQAQEWEFVLGLGRLRLGVGTDKEIDRHLFTAPCIIDLDAATGALFVRLDDSASYSIEDDWILGFHKPSMDDLNEVKEVFDNAEDLEDPTIKKSLIQLAHKFRADLITDLKLVGSTKKESLLLAPALILRKRGKQDLIKLLEALESAFENAQELPAPLQSLLEPGFGEKSSSSDWSGDGAVVRLDDSIYLPLGLNRKQIQALERADTRNATLVQGPPGTGKTRTIAVMVSHFLAKGQRVLVAAETSQALKEVRTQLPDEIRDLAVASLGGGKSDNDDLQKAVNALVEAHENRSELTDGFEKFEGDALRAIDKLHSERAQTIRSIIDLRSQEATKIEIEGYFDSPAHLALTYLDQREKYAWLAEVSDTEAQAPIFTATDAQDLLNALRLVWHSPLHVYLDTQLPAEEELWPEDSFTKALKLRELEGKAQSDFSLPTVYVPELVALIEPVLESQAHLISSDSVWISEATEAALQFSDQSIHDRVTLASANLEPLGSLLEKIGLINEIECPETALTWLPLTSNMIAKISEKGDLKTSATGALKKPLIGSSLSRNAIPMLNSVKIRGKAPHTVADLERVQAIVEFDHLIRIFVNDLQLDPTVIPPKRPDQVVWINSQKKSIKKVIEYRSQCQAIKDFLFKKIARSSKYLQSSLDLNLIYEAALAITAVAELKEYNRKLASHITKVRLNLKGEKHDFVDAYLAALESNDAELFLQTRLIMESFSKRMALGRKAEELAKRSFSKDPMLLATILKWIDKNDSDLSESKISETVQNLVEALRWKRLGQGLGDRISEDYGVLFRAVARYDDQIEKKIRILAKRRSWKKALDRISSQTVSDMGRYAYETRKLGKGTGATAPRRKKEIRGYLEKCIPAIPAWIMPIGRVAQFFPPQLELFDVVIIDEASQARLDSIFLLALAKRVVVVGDHKQVSPDKGYMNDSEIQELVKRHLSGDTRAANWANPDISLFDECKMAFGGMVTLTEHRRCVPGIIGFSNQIAYIPENIRLIPVRQTGSQSLPAIKTIFVPNGYVRGNHSSIVNPPEAEALIEEIHRMVHDRKYLGLTIGVITLQGEKQQELLRNRLIDRIDPSEIEKRQIRVGKPSDFQGSERDVILLSMVMAPDRRFNAQTQEMMLQRYNVAMSRAKDQVVLVHSLRPSDIKNSKDLRRQLIDYCLMVENGSTDVVPDAVGLVSESERDERFDSLFEQRVHNRLVERGYNVIPQYEPQIDGHDYRIDLVVVGPFGKFAIECDGDFWHGPDEYEKDLVRQQTLERCGLRFFRIPESKFYSDPAYLERLWPMLEEFGKIEEKADLEVLSDVNRGELEELDVPEIELDDDLEIFEVVQMESVSEILMQVEVDMDPIVGNVSGESCQIVIDGLRIREYPKSTHSEFGWLEPYRRWDRDGDSTLTPIARLSNAIWGDILEIVQVEGPILGSLLVRRHYKATGGSSLSAQSEREYLKHLQKLLNRAELKAEYQAQGGPLSTATFRLSQQPQVIARVRGDRDLYEIPPQELLFDLRTVIQNTAGVMTMPYKVSGISLIGSSQEKVFHKLLVGLDLSKLTTKAKDHLVRILKRTGSSEEINRVKNIT